MKKKMLIRANTPIAEVMQQKGMTIGELALAVGLSPGRAGDIARYGFGGGKFTKARCLLSNKFAKALDTPVEVLFPEIFSLGEDYPENLVATVFGFKDGADLEEAFAEEREITQLPDDIEESVDFVLRSLTERENAVLELRFQYGMTLDAAASVMGVTRERVRQVEAKAIRKLRHPSRSKILLLGREGWRKKQFEEDLRVAKEEAFQEGYKKGYSKAMARFNFQDMQSFTKDMFADCSTLNPAATRIEDLGLSVRTYNCLKRGGMDCLGDVAKKTEEDLLKLRNFGRKCLDEIKHFAGEYGIIIHSEADL